MLKDSKRKAVRHASAPPRSSLSANPALADKARRKAFAQTQKEGLSVRGIGREVGCFSRASRQLPHFHEPMKEATVHGVVAGFWDSGGRIRTCDLRVMSLIRWIGWATWS
jgi:hypothetical protein